MVQKSEFILDNLKNIQSLREFLKSEISISDPKEGRIIIKIKVYNNAPQSPDAGEVVFLGVGLRIVACREDIKQKGSAYWSKRIETTSMSKYAESRWQYDEGTFFGIRGIDKPFPAVTPDENSQGEALFPGEIVEFQIQVEEADMPYLDICIEGSVSRRHLLHIAQPIHELRKWRQPLINEIFHEVDKIDFLTPLVAITNEVPELGPQTTLDDIDKLKALVEKGITQVAELREKLNAIYRSTQHQQMRDYMKKGIGQYLTSVATAFETTIKAITSSNIANMKLVTNEMKVKVLEETERIKRQRAELISKFGIDV